jgi:hypothetical protein
MRPFRVAIPQDDLAGRLARTRFTRPLPGEGLGVPADRLRKLVEYGREGYDWRASSYPRSPGSGSPAPPGAGVKPPPRRRSVGGADARLGYARYGAHGNDVGSLASVEEKCGTQPVASMGGVS